MPFPRSAARRVRRLAGGLLCAFGLFAVPAFAQQPTVPVGPGGVPTPQTLPPEQARQLLRNRPDLAQQLRERIGASGLTPDQVRARLRAAGYPENLLDDYLVGADTTRRVRPGPATLEAVRSLGLVSAEEGDSLEAAVDSLDTLARDSTDGGADGADSLTRDGRRRDRAPGADRRQLARDSLRLRVFGLDVFSRRTTQFQAVTVGPVDENYRLGPGDALVLILTGDVEVAHSLDVTRDGFVVIPQVGQVNVANLTLAQLRTVLAQRLGRTYSGIASGSTRFDITVSRLRNVQVFVAGDVARPGSFQVSAAATALTALYAAGGPTERGSFRTLLIRRGPRVVDTLDLYDYLLRGDARSDVRLATGDVIFVPPRGAQVKVTGAVLRPAIYELKEGETLRDLLGAAGGFEASAVRSRVQIHRILPPADRTLGRDRVVLDLASERFADGVGPAFPMVMGDSVVVLSIRSRPRSLVTVRGNVYNEGTIGFTPGMKVADALRLAGGPRPDVYLPTVLVSRLQADSTRIQLRVALRDSTGVVQDDIPLVEDDEVTVFGRGSFRVSRYVVVAGAVRKPGRVPYRVGMTLRDALLSVNGPTEDALLTEAEIARLPIDRSSGLSATTIRVSLDSSYVLSRVAGQPFIGPPGIPTTANGAREVVLEPYDNVLILRQPDWELQRRVSITGRVKYPGVYTLRRRDERLVELIERAGGLTKDAYAAGVEFFRAQGRQGRIGIDLPSALKVPGYRDNLVLASGDSINVPEFNPVVRVAGAVNAPVSVAFVPGKDANYYVNAAGGFARQADRKRTYVTQPNGKVEAGRGRKPQPGGSVFVPERDPNDRANPLPYITAATGLLTSLVTLVLVLNR